MHLPPTQNANYYPNDDAFRNIPTILDCLVLGCIPERPIIDKKMDIVAFGSCFADYVSKYLDKAGYNVTTRGDKRMAYIASMGDSFVNTFAILQQFEWAWLGKQPTVDLWYGYDSRAMGYRDEVRVETKLLLDKTDVFILTLGLSEIWYDEPTGEVFWRMVPSRYIDKSRHKFRMATQHENLNNLRSIVSLIRKYKPSAYIVFTLSPVPLKITFRYQSCLVSNEASKASLRSAIDELMSESEDARLFYFPSYELVKNCFNQPYVRDKRHIYQHVVDFMMSVFDCYFCGGISKDELLKRFYLAREQDRQLSLDVPQPMAIDDNYRLVAEPDGRLDRAPKHAVPQQE